MLAYTLEQLLTDPRMPGIHGSATIQRDAASMDRWGGGGRSTWQDHLTVQCRLWFDKAAGVRSANAEYVSPARDVPIQRGGMILPAGTDVTEQDRITEIHDADGNVLLTGNLKITAVLDQSSHLELNFERPHLGA